MCALEQKEEEKTLKREYPEMERHHEMIMITEMGASIC